MASTLTKWSAKDPSDVRDYWVDFAPLGLAADETLVAEVVTLPSQAPPVAPFELLDTVASSPVGKRVVVRYAGGSPATAEYLINYHVTTSTGQEFDVDVTLKVKERVVT